MLSLSLALFATPKAAQAHPSYGLVIDSKGNVYFSDEGASVVWQVDTQGHTHIVVHNVHCHSLAIDSRDNVYGEDVQYESSNNTYISKVWMRSPSGTVTIVMPPLADAPDVLRTPFTDPSGNVYVLELGRQFTRLQTWSQASGFRTIFGGEKTVKDGPARVARFAWPRAFAFTGPGTAYFADGPSVRQLSANGDVTTVAQIPADPRAPKLVPSIMGVSIAGNGDILAADIGTHRIWRLTPAQPGTVRADMSGRAKRQLAPARRITTVAISDANWLPSAVAERGGTIFVLEHGEYHTPSFGFVRVRRIPANGRAQTIATVGARPSY